MIMCEEIIVNPVRKRAQCHRAEKTTTCKQDVDVICTSPPRDCSPEGKVLNAHGNIFIVTVHIICAKIQLGTLILLETLQTIRHAINHTW